MRHSGGGQLRASEPPIVRLMTPCLGGCALLGSVTCALCFLVMYFEVCTVVVREWTYLVDVCVAQGFLLLLEKTYVLQKQVKMKSDIVFFARKRYTVTVNGKYRDPPLVFVVPSIPDFRSMYRKLA